MYSFSRGILFQSIVMVFFIFTTSFLVVDAQTEGFQLYTADDIIVDTSPNIPGPNEQVTLNLNSYSFNLNNYYIAWFQDGVQQNAGIGQRTYSFQTGDSGTIINVAAVVEFEGQVFRKEFRFAPASVDILWEATDAYTPPFYKGKALPLQQASIRATAIPETALLDPTDGPNLIYYWENNYQRDGLASGFGKQSYDFVAEELNEEERISVTVNDRRENSAAQHTVVIPTAEHQPRTLFYRNNNQGRVMTNQAINTNTLIPGDSIDMSFYPLNMSTTRPNFTDLYVVWGINGEDRAPQDFGEQNRLNISSSGESGVVSIQVLLEGIDRVLQQHTEVINLSFSS